MYSVHTKRRDLKFVTSFYTYSSPYKIFLCLGFTISILPGCMQHIRIVLTIHVGFLLFKGNVMKIMHRDSGIVIIKMPFSIFYGCALCNRAFSFHKAKSNQMFYFSDLQFHPLRMLGRRLTAWNKSIVIQRTTCIFCFSWNLVHHPPPPSLANKAIMAPPLLSLLVHIISLRQVEALPILASNSVGGRAITGDSKKARSNLSAYRFRAPSFR